MRKAIAYGLYPLLLLSTLVVIGGVLHLHWDMKKALWIYLFALLTAATVQAPLLLLGLSPPAVFAATVLIDLQTMVSHCNVDVRAGFWNYLLVGPELHRRHHSADAGEGKNYGAVLPLWDLLFGTFRYAAGHRPQRLGVEHPDRYPESIQVLQVLALPFHP